MNMANFIMDSVLIALLVVGVLLGVRLDKRLKALRAAHEGFAQAVHDLDHAAIRAHNSLKELRLDADESQDLLHGRILAARDVVQKLEMQVTRAERVQRELDKGMVNFEAMQSLRTQPVTASNARPESESDGASEWRLRSRTSEAREEVAAAFERDIVRPGRSAAPAMPTARASRLPDVPPEGDDEEILDKVQMSELVVANLNEMIRSLTLPKRQPVSVEDDLFGAPDLTRNDQTRER